MIKFIMEYFGIKKSSSIVLFILCNICVMIFDVIIAYISGSFVDLIVVGTQVDIILKYSIKMIACYLLMIATTYGYQVLSNRLREELCFNITAKIIAHFQKITILKIKKYDSAYLTERIFSDSADIVGFALDNIVNSVVNIFVFIFLIRYALNANIKIAIIFISFLPVYCFIYLITRKGLVKRIKQVKEKQNVYYQRLHEQVKLIEDIKTEGTFAENEKFLQTTFENYMQHFMKYTKFSVSAKSVETLISYAFYAILLIYGAIKIINGKLTIGEFTIINAYFNKAINIINYYMGLGKGFQQTKVSYNRLRELIDIDKEENGFIKIDNVYKLKVVDLSFKYPDGYEYIIKDFKHIFERGKIYVVRGQNGAGKSTFLNLVTGILPSNDCIYINDISLNSLDLYSLRKEKIAVVRQKIEFPFERIGNLVKMPNNAAGVHDETITKLFFNDSYNITNFKDKYPDKLSGGELQKMYLFKMLQKKADVLILDEPTSAFDKSSTNDFFELLNNIKKKKIIIIVSHDSDFCKIADQIIEL